MLPVMHAWLVRDIVLTAMLFMSLPLCVLESFSSIMFAEGNGWRVDILSVCRRCKEIDL